MGATNVVGGDSSPEGSPRFWVSLFTAETWHTAKAVPDIAAWYAERNRKLVNELTPRDLIICYVSRIGFAAVLQATGHPHRVADGPFGDIFPVKVPAEAVIDLELEEALPFRELRDMLDDLEMPTWLVQGSGTEWPEDVGRATLAALRDWADDPDRRELSPRQLRHRPTAGLASSLGAVTIPTDDEDAATQATLAVDEETSGDRRRAPPDVTDHVRIQAMLLHIGRRLGLTPWVTPDDQSKVEEHGRLLADLPGVTTDLPPQFDDATTETIRHIDAMWLNRNRIEAAFEIESTTSIHSGLLRMADLLALQPNLNIPLYVVVPDRRREKALDELGRPVFRALVQPLPDSCRVLTFSRLEEVRDLVEAAHGHVAPGVLEDFSESADSEAE